MLFQFISYHKNVNEKNKEISKHTHWIGIIKSDSVEKDVEHHKFSYYLVNRYKYFRKQKALSCSFDISVTHNQAIQDLEICSI